MLDQGADSNPLKKQSWGGIIATVFVLLVLTGSIVAGVILVQREQDIRNKAASGSACQHSADCELLETEEDSGSFSSSRDIDYLEITHQSYIRFTGTGVDENGCYEVTISGSSMTWNRLLESNVCKDISNIQVWFKTSTPEPSPSPSPTATASPTTSPTASATASPSPSPSPSPTSTPSTPPEPITASCNNVKVFDTGWNRITSDKFDELKAGDVIRLSVGGSATEGSFSRARFTVNDSLLPETADVRPGTDEYYIEYTIPSGLNQLIIKGEVRHDLLGWI